LPLGLSENRRIGVRRSLAGQLKVDRPRILLRTDDAAPQSPPPGLVGPLLKGRRRGVSEEMPKTATPMKSLAAAKNKIAKPALFFLSGTADLRCRGRAAVTVV